jgi:choline dehydrogenase-like flavoprotein
VGGASVHYWGDSWRMPKDRADQWERMGVSGHSHAELEPLFAEIERDLNVHLPEPHYFNRMNRLFETGARALGWNLEHVPQARRGCAQSGHCYQGCAFDAKQSVLVNYIPQAVEAGATLVSDCRVVGVDRNARGAVTGVQARLVDRASGMNRDVPVQVKAPVVVLAAGGYVSAGLWLKWKLPDRHGLVGKHFQCNPNTFVYGIYPEPVEIWRNVPAATGTMDFRLARYEGDRYVEGGYLLHPNQMQAEFLAMTLPGIGGDNYRLMDLLPRIGSAISWIDDEMPGEIRLDDQGTVRHHFDLRGVDLLKARDSLKKQAQVLFASGATEVIVPDMRGTRLRSPKDLHMLDTLDLSRGRFLFPAPHPAGALRMGDDPTKAVVKSTHEAHEVPGLYVADPSVFPMQPSVDPSLTIMALAHIAARHIQERLS